MNSDNNQQSIRQLHEVLSQILAEQNIESFLGMKPLWYLGDNTMRKKINGEILVYIDSYVLVVLLLKQWIRG